MPGKRPRRIKKRMGLRAGVQGTVGGQDTFYVSTFNGVGRIYQQTFFDTYL